MKLTKERDDLYLIQATAHEIAGLSGMLAEFACKGHNEQVDFDGVFGLRDTRTGVRVGFLVNLESDEDSA